MIDNNIYYWFYGVLPQTFGAVIAAIGMVAVYKLSDQRDKIRIYTKSFVGFLRTSGHIYAGEVDMTIEQAIKRCDDMIRQYSDKTQEHKNFLSQKRYFVALLNERKSIIWLFMVPMALCFVMIVVPLVLLVLVFFNTIAMYMLLLGAVITAFLTCINLVKMLFSEAMPD